MQRFNFLAYSFNVYEVSTAMLFLSRLLPTKKFMRGFIWSTHADCFLWIFKNGGGLGTIFLISKRHRLCFYRQYCLDTLFR